MKKLLIIGASILQVPGIKKAKELGYYTAVADYDPNAVGIPLADEYYNVSTIDAQGVTEVAKKFELLIVPSDSFGCQGYARISYCVSTEQITRALPAFKALAEHLRLTERK